MGKTAAGVKAGKVQRAQDGVEVRLNQCENHWYEPTTIFWSEEKRGSPRDSDLPKLHSYLVTTFINLFNAYILSMYCVSAMGQDARM